MKRTLFETEYWKIELSPDQNYFGRLKISLKRDCSALSDITEDENLDFYHLTKRLEVAFKEKYQATMFNWSCSMNNGYLTEPPNPYVHWHFRPRYTSPVHFQGIEFADPNFANHYVRGKSEEKVVDEALYNQIADELSKTL